MKLRSLVISLGALAVLATLAGPAAQAQNSQSPTTRLSTSARWVGRTAKRSM